MIQKKSFRLFTLLSTLGTLIALGGCAPVNLTSVVDTQFILANRDLPLKNLLVVYDARDLGLKGEFEASFTAYLRDNAEVRALRDLDLYSPLKKMTDREKLWALKDESIDGVLYLYGGGSGRDLREWLYPDAADLETDTPAWRSGTVKLFLPKTGQVIWVGSVEDAGGLVDEELNSRGLFSAVTSDLLQRGIIEARRIENPALRGFNR